MNLSILLSRYVCSSAFILPKIIIYRQIPSTYDFDLYMVQAKSLEINRFIRCNIHTFLLFNLFFT